MGSRVVIDQQALAIGCVHWKRTVPYSNVVQRTAQTTGICTGYKENIVVLESGYFFDYLCDWNWFLLSLLIFILFLYFLIRGGGCHWQGAASEAKSHIGRTKMSHWSVIIDIFNMTLWILAGNYISFTIAAGLIISTVITSTVYWKFQQSLVSQATLQPSIMCADSF